GLLASKDDCVCFWIRFYLFTIHLQRGAARGGFQWFLHGHQVHLAISGTQMDFHPFLHRAVPRRNHAQPYAFDLDEWLRLSFFLYAFSLLLVSGSLLALLREQYCKMLFGFSPNLLLVK